MDKQKGLTLSGFILWAVIVVFVVLIGFKLGPSYMEYFAIQKQFKAIAEDPAMKNAPRNTIGGHFNMRSAIENIRSIGPEDLEITRDGDKLVIAASYSVRVPLFGNLSACMDFSPSSEN
jgi:uncharacterized protein DUF4845